MVQTSRHEVHGLQWSEDETPIVSALIKMAARHKLSLHVPGHKQGRIFPHVLSPWLGQALQIDFTELPGLDNLHHATECIAASEALAAKHYGAARTVYSVNGSTAGVMGAILGVAQGKRILVASGFHQSLWKGMVLAGASPVLLPHRFDESRLEMIPPTPDDVEVALAASGNIAAVFITSPTYPGRIADVRGIAKVAHHHGLPLIVDEAHGAHLGLTGELPENSIQAGADVVVQSVHKMLPGLTQTAWVHVQGTLVDANRVREAILTLQTTSPSYLLLASLDACQAWLRLEGEPVTSESLSVLRYFPELRPVPGRDPFRVWIPTGNLDVSRRLADALAVTGTMVEYADELGLLLMFGLQVDPLQVSRFLPVLQRSFEAVGWEQGEGPWSEAPGRQLSRQRAGASSVTGVFLEQVPPQFVASPREVEFSRHERVPLNECAGRIAARMVVPYPPGVPVVYPGQPITESLMLSLNRLHRTGYPTVGLPADGVIEVLAEAP